MVKKVLGMGPSLNTLSFLFMLDVAVEEADG